MSYEHLRGVMGGTPHANAGFTTASEASEVIARPHLSLVPELDEFDEFEDAPAPGALRVADGELELNADRGPDERLTLTVVNTGDRPVQIGSHLHLPDANTALEFDRAAAAGFRLDIASGTSVRYEPGVSRDVDLVALRGRRVVAGLQLPDDTSDENEDR